ncbi:MAG: tetratricopeptide repeat protein [Deltaproteobacteria bacterium]|nr:tetratricopeptide repeat protein [Deltaproteobacteria bacterium]
MQQQDPHKIIDALDKTIAAFPDRSSLYFQRATQYIRLQDWPRARQDIERVLVLDPTHAQAHLIHAQLLAFDNQLDVAIRELEGVQRQPNPPKEIALALARLYLQAKQYTRTEQALLSLARRDPDAFEAFYGLGTLYGTHLKQPQRAVQMYLKAVALQPENLQVRMALGQLLLDLKQYQRALDTLLALERHAAGDLAVQLRIAVVYYEMKDYAHAVQRIERVLEQNPTADKLRYYLAVIYEEAGNFPKAEAVYDSVPEKSQFYKDAQLRIAIHYADAKDFAAATKVLQQAVRRRPKVVEFYEYLAFVLQEQKNEAGTARVLRQAVRHFPQRQSLLYALAISYERLGQRDDAVAMMKKVLAQQPKNVGALNYIGYTYAEWGKHLDEAEELLQRAVMLKPNDGHILDSLAWVYFRKGDFERALVMIEQANRFAPGEPTILRHAAEILVKLRRIPEARVRLHEAQTLLTKQPTPDPSEVAAIERVTRELANVVQ